MSSASQSLAKWGRLPTPFDLYASISLTQVRKMCAARNLPSDGDHRACVALIYDHYVAHQSREELTLRRAIIGVTAATSAVHSNTERLGSQSGRHFHSTHGQHRFQSSDHKGRVKDVGGFSKVVQEIDVSDSVAPSVFMKLTKSKEITKVVTSNYVATQITSRKEKAKVYSSVGSAVLRFDNYQLAIDSPQDHLDRSFTADNRPVSRKRKMASETFEANQETLDVATREPPAKKAKTVLHELYGYDDRRTSWYRISQNPIQPVVAGIPYIHIPCSELSVIQPSIELLQKLLSDVVPRDILGDESGWFLTYPYSEKLAVSAFAVLKSKTITDKQIKMKLVDTDGTVLDSQ